MANQPSIDLPTIRTHKRQFAWQILLPMIVVVIIGLAAGGFVIATTISGQGQPQLWADVSVIWLIAPVLLFALIFLAIVITTIYGMAKLLQILPLYTGKAQNILAQVSSGTLKVADGTVKPFIWLREAGAVVKSLFRKI